MTEEGKRGGPPPYRASWSTVCIPMGSISKHKCKNFVRARIKRPFFNIAVPKHRSLL